MDTEVVARGIEVGRQGSREPLDPTGYVQPTFDPGWSGVVLETFHVSGHLIPRHEHLENFVQVVVQGNVGYEVRTKGRTHRFQAGPGQTFIVPAGTVDEIHWFGKSERIAAAVHPSLLGKALGDPGGRAIDLPEHWDIKDQHVLAVLLALRADRDAGCPAGKLYGESLGNALAIYLAKRYGALHLRELRGGLSGRNVKRVLEYIESNLASDLGLEQLASVAGLSPHHFADQFKRTVGVPPHRFVLRRRIERAKETLTDPRLSIIEAGLSAGFENPSHFARMFRKLVGVSPSTFRADARFEQRPIAPAA
jgi:AraC family transcriptional regulator